MFQPSSTRQADRSRTLARVDSWSNRAYFLCVVGLATFLLLLLMWPKTPVIPTTIATVEIKSQPDQIKQDDLDRVIRETLDAVLTPDALADQLAICWPQFQAEVDGKTLLTRADCLAWMQQRLRATPSGTQLAGYRVITVELDGLDGKLLADLVNHATLEIERQLNLRLRQEQLFAQWQQHQAELEDALHVRRHWLAELETALQHHESSLAALGQLPQAARGPSYNASFVSSSSPTAPANGPEIQVPATMELDLLAAEIEMKQSQLAGEAVRRQWTEFHPEYQNRIEEINGLRQQLETARRQVSNSTKWRENQNEHLPANQPQADPGVPTRVVESAVSAALRDWEQIDAVHSAALQWLGEEEQLTAQLQRWIRGSTVTNAPQVTVLELADPPPVTDQAIPAIQWLAIAMVSLIAAIGSGWLLANQPTRITSVSHLVDELDLPVLGQLPPAARPRLPIPQWLKTHQKTFQLVAEIVVLAILLMMIVSLSRDSRLLNLIMQNPLDGVARALQMFG